MTRTTYVADDPAVPHLAQLLDTDEMSRRLPARLKLGTSAPVTTTRVKYCVGRSLRVVYQVGAGADGITVAGRTFSESKLPRALARAEDNAIPCAGLPPVFAEPDLGALFWTFPNDRTLASLDALLTPSEDLAALNAGQWVQSRLAGYVPEKCAVAACLGPDGRPSGFAKLYAESEAAHAFELLQALTTMPVALPGLRLPRPLGFSEARHVILNEAASGLPLTDSSLSQSPRVFDLLGSAVARFHTLDIPACARVFPRATGDGLQQAAQLIGRALPPLHDRVTTLACALSDAVPSSGDDVLVHGDLHLKNALLDGYTVWLIDLDQAGRGPAAADIGSVLALLRSRAVIGALTWREATELTLRFLDGYEAVRPLPELSALRWHTAAALLEERMLRAISRMRVPLLQHLDGLVADAQKVWGLEGSR
jgi:aminoglycoside phosphotransferase (APT) family kinase protein